MRWPRLTPSWREVLLAASLTAAVELELVLSDRASVARAVAALLITLPLLVRLRFPLTGVTLVVGGTALEAALGGNPVTGPIFPAVAALLALYGAGSRLSGKRLAAAAGLASGGLIAASLLAGADVGSALAAGVLITAAGLVVGGALGVLRFESDAFAERAVELERERDERARVAVNEERRRIARELHDVIGHSISVMGVQAGAVRSVLRADQHREREALLAVERTGRQAVGEMRRLISLLRTDPDAPGDPTPSLREAERLVSQLRDAGLAVRLTVSGDLNKLSPGVDLAAFRILQESLTNALKHAPGADVQARVSVADHELLIEVIDNGDTAPPATPGDLGHGLLGMRERVSLYGGELASGVQPEGGFAVRSRIPLEAP